MNQTTPQWEQALWDELNAMSPDEQILATGEWITHITRNLLTDLGRRRRYTVLDIVESGDTDAGVLAERLGGRRSTFERLAAEGRTMRRDERKELQEAS